MRFAVECNEPMTSADVERERIGGIRVVAVTLIVFTVVVLVSVVAMCFS